MNENETRDGPATPAGAPEMALSPTLREALHEHLSHLKQHYLQRGWAGRVGLANDQR